MDISRYIQNRKMAFTPSLWLWNKGENSLTQPLLQHMAAKMYFLLVCPDQTYKKKKLFLKTESLIYALNNQVISGIMKVPNKMALDTMSPILCPA